MHTSASFPRAPHFTSHNCSRTTRTAPQPFSIWGLAAAGLNDSTTVGTFEFNDHKGMAFLKNDKVRGWAGVTLLVCASLPRSHPPCFPHRWAGSPSWSVRPFLVLPPPAFPTGGLGSPSWSVRPCLVLIQFVEAPPSLWSMHTCTPCSFRVCFQVHTCKQPVCSRV